MTWAMARSSASLGREPRNPAYPWPLRLGRGVDGVAVLGVHDHQRVEAWRSRRSASRSSAGRQVGELVDAGVQQEALEPEHARLVQRSQVGQVARHGATPEAHVDVGLVAGDGPLLLQCRNGNRRRDAVERHVDDRRDAAGRRGPGGAGEALPLGAARLVDVHVGVDEPGQQHLVVGQLDHAGAGRSTSAS